MCHLTSNISAYFRQCCALGTLWTNLANTYSAQLGQPGPSTKYCLKWAEYHYWALLAKLGQVRVLAKLGQSGTSTQYCVKWAKYHYWRLG